MAKFWQQDFGYVLNYVTDSLDYVKYKGKEYKVNVGTESDDGHYTIIELGELK